jgi:hypothetical protein
MEALEWVDPTMPEEDYPMVYTFGFQYNGVFRQILMARQVAALTNHHMPVSAPPHHAHSQIDRPYSLLRTISHCQSAAHSQKYNTFKAWRQLY